MGDKELLEMLVGVIESNTRAMEKSAEASEKMATEVRGLRGVITGAQRRIGGELGPIIDRQKKAAEALEEEVARVREFGGGSAS
jgi:hypothetical protein